MERKKRNRLLELGKDLLIVLLVISALYLTLRTQLSAQLAQSAPDWLSGMLSFIDRGPGSDPGLNPAEGPRAEVRPLRMAVNIAGVGRYGVQYDAATTDKLFDEAFSTVLSEALGSARAPQSVTEREFRAALSDQSGVYFDFQSEVPVGALYAWLEAGPGSALAGEQVRRLLLAEASDGALLLYYCNERTGMYYACQTADTLKGHLQSVVTNRVSNVNEAAFVYEKQKGGDYKELSPYVMLSGASNLRHTVYQASNPIAGSPEGKARKELVGALGFHPQPNTSYTAGGRQVVNEGADTLVVYDAGRVDFHSTSPEEPRYPVGQPGEALTPQILLEATQPIALRAAGALSGDGDLFLMSVTDLGAGRWQVDYGYHLNGVTVRLGSEGYAARFVVSEGRVSDFYFVLRSYAATASQSAVLPERQAAAAMSALAAKGRELTLVYEDNVSASALQAGWIAE